MCSDLGHNTLDFFYGVEEESGELQRGALPHETPVLLQGPPGSGKTCLAGAILCQLYATNGPEELQVVFLDGCQQISPLFAGFPQTSAIAWRAEQVEAALLQPFQSAREDSDSSPFWLMVIDGMGWEDRAMFETSHTWPTLVDLPMRFAREGQSGLRGGLMVISADPLPFFPPFRTTVILGHDQRQINLRRRRNAREQDLLRRLASASSPGQFLIERRRGGRKTGAPKIILAPDADLTSPVNYGKHWPPAPHPLDSRE
jgi:hypothetical protein